MFHYFESKEKLYEELIQMCLEGTAYPGEQKCEHAIDYMPSGHQAYAFLVSYGTVTGGNGDIPKGGLLAMSLCIVKKYKKYDGVIHTNTSVKTVLIDDKKAKCIMLESGDKIEADYVICASNIDYTFRKLLPEKYMLEGLKKMYAERAKYTVSSEFQIVYAVDGVFPELTRTRVVGVMR